MEYTRRGPCGQDGCRETRYFLDNGLWFCRRGHQQEGLQIEEDGDDYGTQGRTHRVQREEIGTGPKTYQGHQGHGLFLQVYQFILWKQCHALVQSQGFPADFENLVRDLWALRLATYEDKLGEPEDSEQPELFSSQPASDNEQPDPVKLGGRTIKWPRLIDSVALCYLAALLMRIPVRVADFHRMIMRGEIPYLRVIRDIPRDIRAKLPQHYLALIETTRLIKPENLHKAILDLLLYYTQQFGVQFPGLNSPLILFTYMRRLALPVEIYPAVNNLKDITGFDFKFPSKNPGRRRALHLPEVQMVALIIISTKLYFPFDDIKRYPVSEKEPSSQSIDWKQWAQIQRHFDAHETEGGKIGKGNEALVTEREVFGMSPEQLDEYMNWYQNSWLDPNPDEPPLADLFPPSGKLPEEDNETPTNDEPHPPTADPEETEEAALDTLLQTSTSQLKPRRVISDPTADVPRPGSYYARYREDSDLPEDARPFFETAAKVAGIPLSTLVRAVYQTETKINRWLTDKRRIQHFGGFSEGEEDDYMDDIEGMEEDVEEPVMGQGLDEGKDVDMMSEYGEGNGQGGSERGNSSS